MMGIFLLVSFVVIIADVLASDEFNEQIENIEE